MSADRGERKAEDRFQGHFNIWNLEKDAEEENQGSMVSQRPKRESILTRRKCSALPNAAQRQNTMGLNLRDRRRDIS